MLSFMCVNGLTLASRLSCSVLTPKRGMRLGARLGLCVSFFTPLIWDMGRRFFSFSFGGGDRISTSCGFSAHRTIIVALRIFIVIHQYLNCINFINIFDHIFIIKAGIININKVTLNAKWILCLSYIDAVFSVWVLFITVLLKVTQCCSSHSNNRQCYSSFTFSLKKNKKFPCH